MILNVFWNFKQPISFRRLHLLLLHHLFTRKKAFSSTVQKDHQGKTIINLILPVSPTVQLLLGPPFWKTEAWSCQIHSSSIVAWWGLVQMPLLRCLLPVSINLPKATQAGGHRPRTAAKSKKKSQSHQGNQQDSRGRPKHHGFRPETSVQTKELGIGEKPFGKNDHCDVKEQVKEKSPKGKNHERLKGP